MSDLDQIIELDHGIADGINTANAAAIAANYTSDAAIMPPGAPRIEGKADIQEYWQAGINAGLSNVHIIADSVDISGDRSTTIGTLSGTIGDAILTGKYIVISRKTEAGWKIHYDIWNYDA